MILINHRFRVSRKVTESSWRKVRSIRFADRNVEFLTVKRADGTSVRFALPHADIYMAELELKASENGFRGKNMH